MFFLLYSFIFRIFSNESVLHLKSGKCYLSVCVHWVSCPCEAAGSILLSSLSCCWTPTRWRWSCSICLPSALRWWGKPQPVTQRSWWKAWPERRWSSRWGLCLPRGVSVKRAWLSDCLFQGVLSTSLWKHRLGPMPISPKRLSTFFGWTRLWPHQILLKVSALLLGGQ